MKVIYTCSGKDESGNFVELQLAIENDPSSTLTTIEFFNFCELCRKRNLTDIGLRYSYEDNKDIYILNFSVYKEPENNFLNWLKSLF